MYFAFNNCDSLKEIPKIPDGVKIMDSAFSNYSHIEEVPELPDSVIDIEGAFALCKSLKTVHNIPKNVKKAKDAFLLCNNITGVVKAEANTQYHSCFEYEANFDFEINGKRINNAAYQDVEFDKEREKYRKRMQSATKN